MIEVDRNDHAFTVAPAEHRAEGLLLHGYGGNKEELLGLAVNLAVELRAKILIPDLPGHGSRGGMELGLESALEALEQDRRKLTKVNFVVGHSLGARLALLAQPSLAVLISMPGEASFAGSRSELLRTLRVRRVRESSPLAGLEEILEQPVAPAAGTLLLRAQQEIAAVTGLCREWQERHGLGCRRIPASNHNDIVSSPQTCEVISQWLRESLS